MVSEVSQQLFKPSGGGLDYFNPTAGMYRMTLIAIEPGKDFGFGPTLNWRFRLKDMGGNEITYVPTGGPNEGKVIPAVADPFTSTASGKGSKARAWFAAILNRVISDQEQLNDLVEEAIGKECMGAWGPNLKGRVILQTVMAV